MIIIHYLFLKKIITPEKTIEIDPKMLNKLI